MAGILEAVRGEGRSLLVVADSAEARAVCDGVGVGARELKPWRLETLNSRVDLLLTGVGKANAAGAAARSLDPDRHSAVLSLGVAGALPGSQLCVCDVVVATESVFADEGVATDAGFSDIASMGFPIAPGAGCAIPASVDLIDALAARAAALGPIATVSTCSGTDDLARAIVTRTGALAEAMEGAAVGLATARVGASRGRTIRFAEVRVISNATGDRARQGWDMPAALDRLGALTRAL